MILSRRAKEALKMGLIVVLALGLAQSFGWERPDWAVFMALVANLGFTGASYLKGVRGILGTVLALPILLAIHAFFPQERWSFLLVLSLVISVLLYLALTQRNAYIWIKSLNAILIIGVGGNLGMLDSADLFNLSVARLQETVLGVAVFVLVQSVLWPYSGRPQMVTTSAELLVMQRELIQACFTSLLSNKPLAGMANQPAELIEKINALSVQSRDIQLENGRSFEERFAWQQIAGIDQALLPILLELLSCRQQLRGVPLNDCLPCLPDILLELDARLAHAHELHLGRQTSRACLEIRLTDPQPMPALDQDSRLALTRLREQLTQLQRQTKQLVELLEAVFLFNQALPQAAAPFTQERAMDWEALQMVMANLGLFWVAALLWINITVPGGSTFLLMSVVLAVSVFFLSRLPTKVYTKLLIPFMLIAALQVIFIAPHLSGFYQLALFLGGNVCLNWYLFKLPAMRLVASIMLLMIGSGVYSNPPVFSALASVTTLLMLLTVFVVNYLVIELLVPMDPARQVLRTRHYFLLKIRHDLLQLLPAHGLGFSDQVIRWLPNSNPQLLVGRYKLALQQWSTMNPQALAADRLDLVVGRAHLVGIQLRTLLRDWQQAQGFLGDPDLRQPFEEAAREILAQLKEHRGNATGAHQAFALQGQRLRDHVQRALAGRELAPDSQLLDSIGNLLHAWETLYEYLDKFTPASQAVDWPRLAEVRF